MGTTVVTEPATHVEGSQCLNVPAPSSCYTCRTGLRLAPTQVPGRYMCVSDFAGPLHPATPGTPARTAYEGSGGLRWQPYAAVVAALALSYGAGYGVEHLVSR